MWAIAGMMLVVGILAGSPLYAETTAERLLKQDIDRRDQERRDQRWDESHTPNAVLPGPQAPTTPSEPSANPAACFTLHHIQLNPGHILAPERAHKIVAAYQGRCVQAADLAALQEALNAEALAEGLVTTRVVVPEQNLASGKLMLEVWPGTLEKLQSASLTHRQLAQACPQRPGDLLQLRALEQTVDNFNRLASWQASVELQPAQKVGGSIADFTVVRTAPWQAGISWQGDALNGESSHTVRANLTLDNPLRLLDRLTLGLNGNLKDGQVDDAHGGSMDYDLPLGWWRFSAGADRFDYKNPITAGVTTFVASGESQSWRAEISRVLHRDAHNRFSMALHGKERLSHNFINDVTIGVSSNRVYAMGLRSDFSRVAAPWVFDATLDAETGRASSPALISPIDNDYSRVLSNSRLQYYFERASLTGSVSGQWSDSRLAPSEQFTLTSQVPGFIPVSLNANTGISAQLEMAYPFLMNRAGFTSLRPTFGLAWALAPHAAGNISREQVTAIETGITAPWRRAVMNMGADFPVEKTSSIQAPDNWQLHASFSVQW
jgi:hemolysin activation/secretion protein